MRTLLLALLVFCATADEPGWPGAVASGEARQADTTIVDPRDGTRLDLRLHYPANGTALPVVVFSHGLGGSKEGYAFLGQHWAAHGYVSIHLTHPGSDTAKARAGGLAAMRAAMIDPAILAGRPQQVAAVIDALPAIALAVPGLTGRVDGGRVAVAGHSYGAYTTLAVAGLRIDLPGGPNSTWADARPRAFIALSPQGTSPGMDREAWSAIARPVLVMTGSADGQSPLLARGDVRHDGAWREEAFTFMPAGGKHLVFLTDATHSTFSGGAGAALVRAPAPDSRHLDCIRAATLAMLDAHLRDDAAARRWLDDGAAVAEWGAAMVRVANK